MTIYYIILTIITFNFIFNFIINFLNLKHKGKISPDLKDLYDEKKVEKSIRYKNAKIKVSLLEDFVGYIIFISAIFLGAFYELELLVKKLNYNYMTSCIIFINLILLTLEIIKIPFSIYRKFIIEEQFGFNKMKPTLFLSDRIKSFLLTIIFSSIVIGVVMYLYESLGYYSWIYSWVILSMIMIFINMFYSTLIVPLFNKQKELEDGNLKESILNFSKKVGFKLSNIFVIDGSKRSSKSNAYFSGLGPNKRIVLFDTLINQLSVKEIVAVFAHEVGHYKKRHLTKSMFISIFQIGIILFVFFSVIENIKFSQSLGYTELNFAMSLIVFSILYIPISIILNTSMYYLSRKWEYEADSYSKENYNKDNLTDALKKLFSENLSDPFPHQIYVFFNYSHPTLEQRIMNLK